MRTVLMPLTILLTAWHRLPQVTRCYFFQSKPDKVAWHCFNVLQVLRQGVNSKYPQISRPHFLRDDFSIAAIKSLCSKNSFGELTTRLIENSFVSESYSSFFAFDEKLGVTEKWPEFVQEKNFFSQKSFVSSSWWKKEILKWREKFWSLKIIKNNNFSRMCLWPNKRYLYVLFSCT